MASQPDQNPVMYPPNINAPERDGLVEVVKDWTIAHGLSVLLPPATDHSKLYSSAIQATSAPVTLFPSPFPRTCFQQAKSAQRAYNELYAKISQDEDFLAHVVSEVADGDDFITDLWHVHLKVKEEGYIQRLSLGLFRSDYMVHWDTSDEASVPQIKQVEFNTIASSFGGLSSQTSGLHKFLAKTEYPALEGSSGRRHYDLPDNGSTDDLAAGLVAAFNIYPDSDLGYERCIIFLVQAGERNVFDQRHLEYAVKTSSPSIAVFRLPFGDILDRTSIANTAKRQLLYRPPSNPLKVFEVAVVYFRAGYGPSDYPTQSAWDARLQIERSLAIKCPSVLTQLAGTKKVQQVLATPREGSVPSEMHRFIPDDLAVSEEIRQTFTQIYPLDDSKVGRQAREWAVDAHACMKFVLKPQREGGGNNHYKANIPEHLKTVPEERWKSYILMELITPPPVSNMILRNGCIEHGGVICELGIYGTCVWDETTGAILHNEEAGYLLRTKGDQSDEGGVAAGYGCMDSCHLV